LIPNQNLEVYLLGFDFIKLSTKEKKTLGIRRREREGKKDILFERKALNFLKTSIIIINIKLPRL